MVEDRVVRNSNKWVVDLVFRSIVDRVAKGGTVGNIQFMTAESPGDEDNVARLRVERKILDV